MDVYPTDRRCHCDGVGDLVAGISRAAAANVCRGIHPRGGHVANLDGLRGGGDRIEEARATAVALASARQRTAGAYPAAPAAFLPTFDHPASARLTWGERVDRFPQHERSTHPICQK